MPEIVLDHPASGWFTDDSQRLEEPSRRAQLMRGLGERLNVQEVGPKALTNTGHFGLDLVGDGLGGGIGGAIGGAIGSVFPDIGPAMGAVAGSLGGTAGAHILRKINDEVKEHHLLERTLLHAGVENTQPEAVQRGLDRRHEYSSDSVRSMGPDALDVMVDRDPKRVERAFGLTLSPIDELPEPASEPETSPQGPTIDRTSDEEGISHSF